MHRKRAVGIQIAAIQSGAVYYAQSHVMSPAWNWNFFSLLLSVEKGGSCWKNYWKNIVIRNFRLISCQFVALNKPIITQTDRVQVKKAPRLEFWLFFIFPFSISCAIIEKKKNCLGLLTERDFNSSLAHSANMSNNSVIELAQLLTGALDEKFNVSKKIK